MLDLLRTAFGLNLPEPEPLSGGRVNRLWRCGDWVVKVYDHRQVPVERAARAIQLQQRAAALGFPVPEPLTARSGSLWAESGEGMVVVMPFVRGRRRARGTLNATEASNLGLLLGSLHEMLRNLPLEQPARPSRPSPDSIRNRWERLKGQAQALRPPTDFEQVVVETADYVSAALGRMSAVDWDAQPWQMCHGDLHLDNLLFDDSGRVVGLLDFDNAAPSWAGVELMMAWNLCFGADPGKPSLSAEAGAFFAAYQRAYGLSSDLATSLQAYWYTLISNTWPAAIRYREGSVKPEWVELISMRYEAARWIEANQETITRWFASERSP